MQSAAKIQRDVEERDFKRREEGCKAIVDNLIDTMRSTYNDILNGSSENFGSLWEIVLKDHLVSTMALLDRSPVQDLGSRKRIVLAFSLQTHVRTFIYLTSKDLSVFKTQDGYERLKEKIKNSSLPQFEKFSREFLSTYKRDASSQSKP